MSNTRSSGNLLFPPTNPESLLRAASAEKRQLAKILANATEPNVHVPSTSHPSTSFHTPATSSPGTPAIPPFTPSLLRTKSMADPPNPIDTSHPGGTDPPNNTDPPKGTDPPKRSTASGSKGGGSPSVNSANKNPMADHYIELLLKLQHTAAVQLQEEQNTLFDVVTKAEEEKQARLTPVPKDTRLDLQRFRIADGPRYRGPSLSIEPFLKWIQQLQIFFSTKGVVNDNDKICVAGGLLEETGLLDFYAYEGASFADKSWDTFKSRLFEVALPQQWRTTLKTNLRQISMSSTESFINFSGRARTLQCLINFDISPSSPTANTRLSDFDLAEFVVLGIPEELRGEVIKFALLDVDPFVYAAFEKRTAVFDEVIKKRGNQRPHRSAPRAQSPVNSSPDPAAWRVHAYLDSQGHSSTGPAGKPTHPPAGRPPLRSASVAAVSDVPVNETTTSGTDYVDVVDAIEMDHRLFEEVKIDDSLPPDLSADDYAIFDEIDAIRFDSVAGAEEDNASLYESTYGSDLGRDPLDDTASPP
ncbi:hypothetical protein Pst134EA_004904 [Puccinia striiformis f. sp. tritici]|uniref:hypothetical protein n=1 Tax=Puccinia striiformis f. sp. tritici TaxID=168172 RepID=UPI002007DF83|nr:hypothetical protein Pst134EA_004904 [Puccinia striiformis f. sp. tritici]KAH9470994.1 hypothetical protein Pst134EA_004904 [Puccinia striiformis f. sp. tritici]